MALQDEVRTQPPSPRPAVRAPRMPGLEGLCAALLPPEAGGPDPEALAREVAALASRMPPAVRWGLRTGAATATAAALASRGRSLSALDPARREAVLRFLALLPGGRSPVEAVRTLVLAVAGATRHAGEVVEESLRTPPVRPDPPLDVTPAGAWPARSRCDAVVVGSGAGGAMAARTLARAGLRTVIVEEGRRFTVEEFRGRPPLERYSDLYRDGGATFALGRPPILLPLGRAVGGTTVVNSGTCYRTPQRVLRWWRDRAGLGAADPDAFAPRLEEAWTILRPLPVAPSVMGRNGEIALAGAEALRWGAGPLMHNARGCAGCCQSAVGCPRNAKSGVDHTALPEACLAGARILSEARVERLLHERGRAVGVVACRPDGSPMEIRAPRVVVSAGATETPPLLRRSGLGAHPHLGRNLSIHPAIGALGRFEDPVSASRGVLQSVGIEEFHLAEGILLEATAAPPGLGWASVPGIGRGLLARLERAEHLAGLGGFISDGPAGSVLGRRRAVVRYGLRPLDARGLVRALALIGRALFAAGAAEVYPGIPGTETVGGVEELDAALDGADPRRLRLAAFHPSGTARAGADASRYPVDPGGRLRGVDGVWVADASILPTCPGVNPQVTIMALALAVSEEAARS